MFGVKFNKIWVILGVVALLTAFFIITRDKGDNDLTVVAGEKVVGEPVLADEIIPVENKHMVASSSVSEINNKYFQARVGTYWIFAGQSVSLSESDNVKSETKSIKLKHEVTAISGETDNYLITVKTTNLLDQSVKEGTIEVKKDYVIFDVDEFYNYVRYPLRVGSRWAEGYNEGDTEPLREDGYYQNRINWQLKDRILGHDCYNIIFQTLPDTLETIWCDQIGPLQNTYHHNGSLDDSMVRLTKYHY